MVASNPHNVLGGARGTEDDVYLIANLPDHLPAPARSSEITWLWDGPAEHGLLLCRLDEPALTLRFSVTDHGHLLAYIALARTLTICHAPTWGVDADPLFDLSLSEAVATALRDRLAEISL